MSGGGGSGAFDVLFGHATRSPEASAGGEVPITHRTNPGRGGHPIFVASGVPAPYSAADVRFGIFGRSSDAGASFRGRTGRRHFSKSESIGGGSGGGPGNVGQLGQ